MPRDQDLRYAIRVQDAQLKELIRNNRVLTKQLDTIDRSGTKAGAGAAAGYDKADRGAKKATASTRLYGMSVKDTLKLGLGAGAGFATIEGAASFLRATVPAALEAERSLVRLETQLEAVDLATDENVSTLEKAIRKQTLLAGVIDDEVVRDALTNMVRSTRDVTKAVELNALALDIAIGKEISLETASRLVARVYAGNTGALGRYGITIDKTATSTEALTILQERFAGQAARAGDTAEGKFGRVSFRVEELQEKIGGQLIPVMEDLAEVVELTAIGLEKLSNVDVSPGFDFPDLPDWAKSGLRVAPISPLGAAVLAAKKALEDSNDELSVFDRMAGDVASTFDDITSGINATAQAIEKRLRTRLADALEEVHDKALAQFDRNTDAMANAHDRITDELLRSFDKTTDEMIERLRVVVKVGERQFEIGRGELTPAERELEALEKLDAKRRTGRELHDARADLGQALLIGDPAAIADAKRRVQDAELEQRKTKLQSRAETERELADKALTAEEERLRDGRDALRRDLEERRRLQRRDLEQRRQAQRANLDAELAAQAKALEKGKRTAANAQQQILATLRKFGADYKGVGADLGGKFLEGFLQAMVPTQGKGKSKALLLPGTVDPKTGRVIPLFPPTGGARGGLAGQLGKPGPSDTVIAGLTPGEMILTRSDQRQLAKTLGAPAIGWPLLSKIRMGFAEGGVVDEDFLRMLLKRFSAPLSEDAVHRGTGLTDPRFLQGTPTRAERRALSPVHIQSMLFGRGKAGDMGLSAKQRAELGPAGLRTLMNELAQRQAHPQRAGLIRVGASGAYSAGPGGRDPGIDSGMSFGGPMTWNITESSNARRTANEVRRELLRLKRRNAKRSRGRNAGTNVGLG